MKDKKTALWIFWICLLVALLVAGAAAVGVFFRGDESSEMVTSPRGEMYRMITSGIYSYNSERMVAEGVGWDIFTLFLAVPAMLVLLPSLRRGSRRARLIALGLLAYFFYQYFMYALGWAFGPLFMYFILIFVASLAGIVWIASSMDAKALAASVDEKFPRRGMAVLCFLVALLLIGMWSQRILAGLQGDYETAMLLGQTTMVVQALDLGLIVPLAVFTGIAILRKLPVGYLLSSVVAVKAIAMAGAILAMLLSAWAVEGSLELVPFVLFSLILAASSWLALRIFRAVP